MDGVAAGQTWPGQEWRQGSQVLLSKDGENSTECWLIFQPSRMLLIAQWIIHPSLLFPPLSPLTPALLMYLHATHICHPSPGVPTIRNSKRHLPLPQHQGLTLLGLGYSTWMTEQRNIFKSWIINEHPVIIEVKLQITKHPPVEEWTCFKDVKELKLFQYKTICDKT